MQRWFSRDINRSLLNRTLKTCSRDIKLLNPNLKFKVTVSKEQEISRKRNEVNDKKCGSETLKVKESISYFVTFNLYQARNYKFKVNSRNTRIRCGIRSRLTIKTPEQRHWRRSDFFIVNFEHFLHLVLVFLLLSLSR